jgi:hypothetical protein
MLPSTQTTLCLPRPLWWFGKDDLVAVQCIGDAAQDYVSDSLTAKSPDEYTSLAMVALPKHTVLRQALRILSGESCSISEGDFARLLCPLEDDAEQAESFEQTLALRKRAARLLAQCSSLTPSDDETKDLVLSASLSGHLAVHAWSTDALWIAMSRGNCPPAILSTIIGDLRSSVRQICACAEELAALRCDADGA